MNAVIALNPQQMQEAQATTVAWIDEKLRVAKIEIREAQEVVESLGRNMMANGAATRQVSAARRRLSFYEKVKSALDAGYYIVPPFPVQVFAIRTDRGPPDECGTGARDKEYPARALPVGEGNYFSPNVPREFVETEKRKNAAGSEYTVDIYKNADDWRDVELPVRAFKPEVIAATGRALAEKIFDALGILPAYRSADPLIVGQIKHLKKYHEPLTFFVAWWLDERVL